MKLRLPFAVAVAGALALAAACADSSDETSSPSATDAGTLDAKTRPLPPGDDDDFAPTDDDDDDAGPDGATPKDAGADAKKDSAPPPPLHKRVFVTKTRYTGDLKTQGAGADGLEGADNLCAKAASDGSLGGGPWKAWVSTSLKNAGERILDHSPWYLVDQTTLVFPDLASLASPPMHRIDQNETGGSLIQGSLATSNRVWTGTNTGGVLTPGKNCSDFATDTTGTGTAGVYFDTGANGATNWTRYVTDPEDSCANKWALYCFEQ